MCRALAGEQSPNRPRFRPVTHSIDYVSGAAFRPTTAPALPSAHSFTPYVFKPRTFGRGSWSGLRHIARQRRQA
jgi:hypothetical protein